MELYPHSRYRGYLLFVEDTTSEDYPYYEGGAQLNGTTTGSPGNTHADVLVVNSPNLPACDYMR